jgi:hypothetical protein
MDAIPIFDLQLVNPLDAAAVFKWGHCIPKELHLNRRPLRSTGRQLSLGDDHPQEGVASPGKADRGWYFGSRSSG